MECGLATWSRPAWMLPGSEHVALVRGWVSCWPPCESSSAHLWGLLCQTCGLLAPGACAVSGGSLWLGRMAPRLYARLTHRLLAGARGDKEFGGQLG